MRHLYQYAVLRVVPRPERGESVNAGVALYCPERSFLKAKVHLDAGRLLALSPRTPRSDHAEILRHLEVFQAVCEGGPAAGALGGLSQRERFGRIVSVRNTVIQPSPTHTGFTEDPEAELGLLLRRLVTDG